MRFFENNALSIGNTPLIKLRKLCSQKTLILGKVEGRNPSYSVKARIGVSMIWDAEKRGMLKPGMSVVEPTSGNTGIALAFVGATKGYKVILTMPETMSIERRKILKALGAEIKLTQGDKGMAGAIEEAKKLVEEFPEKFFMPQQFENPANPAIHEVTTGPEIWQDTDGNVDVIIAGVGTGGTITGISRYLKKQKRITTVAVEPADSPVITQTLNGEKLTPNPHMIQGIGAGFIPKVLDLSIIDKVETITNEEAMEYARFLAKEEGILAGISAGAAVAAAVKLTQKDEFKDKNIVVILPDSGERYLSTSLYSNI